MTTVLERVKTALDTLSPAVPYALSVYETVNGADLPNTYIVYQEIVSSPEQHADDAEALRSYLIQVTTYQRGGLTNLPNSTAALIAAGFIKSNERQLRKDPQTGHHGLATEFVYIE